MAAPSAAAAPVAVRRPSRVGLLFFAAVAWIVVLALAAIFAGHLPLPSPTEIDMFGKRAAPSAEHWLGNDQLGRDVFSRTVGLGSAAVAAGSVATPETIIAGSVTLYAFSKRLTSGD